MKNLMAIFLAALAAFAAGRPLHAQEYPSKEIFAISGYVAGSTADILTRHFTEKLSRMLGKPVLVDFKPGALSNIASEYVARAKPDGYTAYFAAGSALAANMHLFKKSTVDATRAFQVAATINRQSFVIVVDAKRPIHTLADLTAYIKQKREKALYATGSPTGVILGALYKEKAGLQAEEVPYKGGIPSALGDLSTGMLDYAIADPILAFGEQRKGTLRLLAVGTAERLNAAPDVPTLAEQGILGVDLLTWWSVVFPAQTPHPVVDKWNALINQILATEDTRKFLNSFGSDPFISTPDEAQALLRKEAVTWGEYIRIAKIQPWDN